jgi:hypothetical protein
LPAEAKLQSPDHTPVLGGLQPAVPREVLDETGWKKPRGWRPSRQHSTFNNIKHTFHWWFDHLELFSTDRGAKTSLW